MTSPASQLPIDVSVPSTPRGAWRRRGWPPLLVAVGCAGAYGLFLLLPYYAAGLGDPPLPAVVGRVQDLDLDGIAGAFLAVGGLVTYFLGPAVALGAAAWAALRTAQGITASDLRQTAPALVGTAIAVGTLAWLFSPLGREVMAWFID
ncbi:hypothetical protein [Nocardioides sp. P5_C9_2]